MSKVGVAWSLDLMSFHLVKKARPCRRKIIPNGDSSAVVATSSNQILSRK